MGAIVRLAEEHLMALHELEEECFSMPWSLEALRGELTNPLAFYLVSLQDDRVLGYIGMHIVLDEGHITNLAVTKAARRRGIADQLMAEILKEAEKRDLSFLELEVRVSNEAALGLYHKNGFLPVGKRTGYYEAPREDALLMTRFMKQIQEESETRT